MSRLPSLKPRQVVAALERAGFTVVRVIGSHYQMFNERTRRHTTVPHHSRDLPHRFRDYPAGWAYARGVLEAFVGGDSFRSRPPRSIVQPETE